MSTKEKTKTNDDNGCLPDRDDDFGVYLANKHKEKTTEKPKKSANSGKEK